MGFREAAGMKMGILDTQARAEFLDHLFFENNQVRILFTFIYAIFHSPDAPKT